MRVSPGPTLPPLSDQDRKLANTIGGVIEHTRREFEQAAQEVEFRKWCVGEAVKICVAQSGSDISQLTSFIYDFCHQPMDRFMKPPSPG
jgi:hypothetical protein